MRREQRLPRSLVVSAAALLADIWTASLGAAPAAIATIPAYVFPEPSGSFQTAATNGDLPGPVDTATWHGKLYAAPMNSNTRLLWYRKDLVPNPPKTWTEMLADAERLAKQGKPHYIEEQGSQYEELVVWFNSLVNSAGGPFQRRIVSGLTAGAVKG